jgi:hypothetical protein
VQSFCLFDLVSLRHLTLCCRLVCARLAHATALSSRRAPPGSFAFASPQQQQQAPPPAFAAASGPPSMPFMQSPTHVMAGPPAMPFMQMQQVCAFLAALLASPCLASP